MTEQQDFAVDVALTLFAVSLGFSIQFAYSDLKFFPTKFLYHLTSPCDPVCRASVVFDALNVLLLLVLGAFWYYRGELRSWLPVGGLGFMFYLIIGAIVGISPWFVYIITGLMPGVR